MRRAELVGLRWSGADLGRGVLTVERPILQLGGRLSESKPKTRAGERKVFLDTETAELLRQWRKAWLGIRLRAGEAWQDDDLIFCQPDGRPWLPDHVSRRFRRLAARQACGSAGHASHAPMPGQRTEPTAVPRLGRQHVCNNARDADGT